MAKGQNGLFTTQPTSLLMRGILIILSNFEEVQNAYKIRGRVRKIVEFQKRKSDQSESRKKIIRNQRVNLRVFE